MLKGSRLRPAMITQARAIDEWGCVSSLICSLRCRRDDRTARAVQDSGVREGRSITAAGMRARVIEAGDGPVGIVLLASQLVLAKSYRPTIDALLKRHLRVRVVEMPGCGGGSRLREPWTTREYARW